jgi:hypothetical protein
MRRLSYRQRQAQARHYKVLRRVALVGWQVIAILLILLCGPTDGTTIVAHYPAMWGPIILLLITTFCVFCTIDDIK